MKTSLPESLATTVKSTIADWQSGGKVKRLWDRDASLWTGKMSPSGWAGLDIVEEQVAEPDAHQKFAKDVRARGFEPILRLGMGEYTFGVVKAAQARGDLQVLAERGRRALRVHLGKDLKIGLAALQPAVQKGI